MTRVLGWAATTASVFPAIDGDEQQRVALVLSAPSRVDAQTIEHIEAVLWRCRRQDYALGPQAVLTTVLAQRDLARALVPECPASLRSRLLSALSDASRPAGWLSLQIPIRGECHLKLCEADRAVSYGRLSLEILDRSCARDVAMTIVDLGEAYVQCNEIDEAARLLGDAGDIAARNSSARLIERLKQGRVAALEEHRRPPTRRSIGILRYGVMLH